MASGDVFSDMHVSTTGLTIVTPTEDSVITWFAGDSNANGQIWGCGSSGNFQMNMDGGETGNNTMPAKINFMGMKMFITSTERFGIGTGSGTSYFAYSGMEL